MSEVKKQAVCTFRSKRRLASASRQTIDTSREEGAILMNRAFQ